MLFSFSFSLLYFTRLLLEDVEVEDVANLY
jgi:hypothetical protein